MMFPVRIEIIPSEGIVEQVRALVASTTTLSVTSLPHHGIERTVRTALELRDAGYRVIPHLAARSIRSRSELTEIIRNCNAADIREVFVIGGDRKRAAGVYDSALPVLEDIAQYTGGTMRAGVAGSVPRTKLAALAAQIGVGSSLKFLSRKGPLARKLLSGERYSPDSLIAALETQPGTIAGIHLYSFNSLDTIPGHSLRGDAGSPNQNSSTPTNVDSRSST